MFFLESSPQNAPAKLFDNYWQIVPVGLQKERSSSQHNQLSSKSKYQITNRKIH